MSEGALSPKEIADLRAEEANKETVAECIVRLRQTRENGTPEPHKLPTALPVTRIEFGGSALQPRDFGNDRVRSEVHTRTLTEAVKSTPGHCLEAVTVWWTGEAWAVVDGHHRVTAYRRAFAELTKKRRTTGKPFRAPSVPVKVFSGSVAAAVREAGAQNSRDKLAMTKAEKLQRAWLLVMLDDPDISKSGIAAATGVSDRTVATMRSRMKEISDMPAEERDGHLGCSLLDSLWEDVKGRREMAEPDDWGKWEEEQAQRWARELGKAFGSRPTELPNIFARAIAIYSDALPGRMVRGAWSDIAQDFVDEANGEGMGDF